MKELARKLTDQTADLLAAYLDQTRRWAASNFDAVVARDKWTEEQWCRYLGITPEITHAGTTNEHFGFPKGFYNRRESSRWYDKKDEIARFLRWGRDGYIDRELNAAKAHYLAATEKLADRIIRKGLDPERAEVTHGRVGVNMEVTVSDGEREVRSFTIVASGPVQRPHYRYLIH